MSGEFIKAVQLDILTVKNAKGYTCICGMSIGISVDNIDPGDAAPLLRAAHKRHHDNHFGVPATLYMQGETTPPGNNAIVKAWCSCDHKLEAAYA